MDKNQDSQNVSAQTPGQQDIIIKDSGQGIENKGISNRIVVNLKKNTSNVENGENENESVGSCAEEMIQDEKADIWSATVNMVKGFFGIGILALPSGFARSGWLGGILFFILCGLTILYLSLQMIEVADRRGIKARNVTEFSMQTLGNDKEILVNIFLFSMQLSICVAYVLFFATYFQESLCFFVDQDKSNILCGSRFPSLIFSIVLVSPSIFVRHMTKLKSWSMFANGLIMISLIVIIVSCFIQMNQTTLESDKVAAMRWSEFGNAVGIFIFTFEGTTLYFEIRYSMKQPTDFKTVLKFSMLCAIIMYLCIGLAGYLAFGIEVRDIILFNFSMTNPLYVFIQIFYSIAILLSYPLQMFPLVNIVELKIIERLIRQYQNLQQEDEVIEEENTDQAVQANARIIQRQVQQQSMASEAYSAENPSYQIQFLSEEIKKRFYTESIVVRITFLLLVFVVAIAFKRLTVFLNFIGSVAGCFFCFVLPVVVYEKSMPDAPKKKIYLHRFILIIGIAFCLIGTVSSLKAIYDSY